MSGTGDDDDLLNNDGGDIRDVNFGAALTGLPLHSGIILISLFFNSSILLTGPPSAPAHF